MQTSLVSRDRNTAVPTTIGNKMPSPDEDRAYFKTQIKELRHCASAVYLACAESVAADISDKLTRAADSIERLVTNSEAAR